MIERLIAALDDPAGRLSAEMIAEALWLARYLPGPLPPTTGAGQPAPAVEPADGRSPGDTGVAPEDRSGLPGPTGHGTAPGAGRAAAAQMFAAGAGRPADLGTSLMAVGGPAVHALPHVLELQRSLAPLRRAVHSDQDPIFDEQRTAELSADSGQLQLAFTPSKDQWLDLVLVIDRSPSMAVWESTVDEVIDLATRHTAFGEVRVFQLRTHRADERPLLSASRTGPPRDPTEVLDPARHQLVLVVSDCIAPMWGAAELMRWLDLWGRHGPIAVVQPLPQRLWDRCRPVTHLVSLRPPYPGAPMSAMRPQPRTTP